MDFSRDILCILMVACRTCQEFFWWLSLRIPSAFSEAVLMKVRRPIWSWSLHKCHSRHWDGISHSNHSVKQKLCPAECVNNNTFPVIQPLLYDRNPVNLHTKLINVINMLIPPGLVETSHWLAVMKSMPSGPLRSSSPSFSTVANCCSVGV